MIKQLVILVTSVMATICMFYFGIHTVLILAGQAKLRDHKQSC